MLTERRKNIFDYSQEDLQKEFEILGEPAYRMKQLWTGIYHHYWKEIADFSTLPSSLRAQLENNFSFSPLRPTLSLDSIDGETRKTLFELSDGSAIETVLMGYHKRRTLCISTQVGCGMDCVFCATGQMGFKRNLTAGEIVAQVIFFAHQLHSISERVTNIVIMGIGEPFHNYEATMKAIDILNHPEGMNLGERRFTISTVGLIPSITRFTKEKRQINLAISLHGADDELRSRLLPINMKYPISDLIKACKNYVEVTGRRITFEWALIQGVNDSIIDAQKLSQLLRGMLSHVNIIQLNPTKNFHGRGSDRTRAIAFRDTLTSAGIPCTIRTRRGVDIQAGCGQLASLGVHG